MLAIALILSLVWHSYPWTFKLDWIFDFDCLQSSAHTHNRSLVHSSLRSSPRFLLANPSGLMVAVLNYGSSGPGLCPGRGHGVLFSGKTVHSHSSSLHTGTRMSEFNAGGNPAMD